MDLDTWTKAAGKSLSDVQRDTGVAYTTVIAAKRGKLNRYDVAKKISEYTGGKVTIPELCEKRDSGDGEAA